MPTVAGEQLSIDAGGRMQRLPLAADDAEWAWTQSLATPPPMEGRSAFEMLAWVARESGKRLVFADAEAELRARAAILHGESSGLHAARGARRARCDDRRPRLLARRRDADDQAALSAVAAGTQNVRLIALCVLGLLSPARQAAAQPSLQGLSLEDAIGALEAAGLTVFYSSELVKPTMRVTVQPEGTDLREMLRAILEPHGLTIAPGPRDSVLIVVPPPPVATAAPGPRRPNVNPCFRP